MGIEELKKVLGSVSSVVTDLDTLRAVDWKSVLKELLDLDEVEMGLLVSEFKLKFNLVDDALEAKIESLVGDNAKYLLLVLKLLRLFV